MWGPADRTPHGPGLDQGHTAEQPQSQNPSPGCLAPKPAAARASSFPASSSPHSTWVPGPLCPLPGLQVKPEVLSHPEQFSLIYSRHPFIVPGGRFVEFYYW